MKVGILTFHRALNYGAVLQCFALQETLKELNCSVAVIDYRPDYIEKYRKVFSCYSLHNRRGLKDKTKELLVRSLLAKKTIRARTAFDCFLDEFLNIESFNSLDELETNYDAIVIGSDQVWSPTIGNGFDYIYWGNFPHSRTKLVSYAASIGGHNTISNEMWGRISNLLSNFDSISVRESSFAEQLSKHTGQITTVVLDPTLLVDKQKYDSIAQYPDYNNYLLLFLIVEDKNAIRFAEEIASEKGLKIIRIKAIEEFEKCDKNIIDYYSIMPQRFLGYFAKADFIVTNSFHGTAFSLIFQKYFYSLDSTKIDRAKSLLDSLGLSDRIINSQELGHYTEIDYSGFNERLENLKNNSLVYLRKSLKE